MLCGPGSVAGAAFGHHWRDVVALLLAAEGSQLAENVVEEVLPRSSASDSRRCQPFGAATLGFIGDERHACVP
jgi:hypothetical protein